MLGFATIRAEGAPIHPDEITYECDCEVCRGRYDRQLAAYNAYHGIVPHVSRWPWDGDGREIPEEGPGANPGP